MGEELTAAGLGRMWGSLFGVGCISSSAPVAVMHDPPPTS